MLSAKLLAPAQPAAGRRRWGRRPRISVDAAQVVTAFLVIVLGLGGHAGKNALSPAEPALKAQGWSPLAYGILASTPTAGGMIGSLFWGAVYRHSRRGSLLGASLGVFAGQMLLALGLVIQDGTSSCLALSLGVVVFSVCRSGLAVLQHVELAQALPLGLALTRGFVAMIGVTHLTIIACNWAVPRLVAAAGLAGMQLALLLPSAFGAAAAWLLAARAGPRAEERAAHGKAEKPAQSHLETMSAASTAASESYCQEGQGGWMPLVLLCSWKALTLGLQKSLGFVANSLAVEQGLTSVQAGSLIAAEQSLALLALPFVGVFSSVGDRFVFLAVSTAILVGVFTLYLKLSLAVGLLLLAATGVVAPVLPLALLPASLPRPSALAPAFAFMESLVMLTEMALNVSFGELCSSPEGFSGVFVMSFVVTVVALIFAAAFSFVTPPADPDGHIASRGEPLY